VSVIVGVDATFVPEGYLGGPEAVSSQRDAIARVLTDVMARASDAGVILGSSFEILPFFSARVTRESLEALAAMRGVTSIEVNGLDKADLASSVPITNAPPAWSAGHTGAGWTVAVIDTGIEKTHGFLSGKVQSEACYVNAGGSGVGTSTCPGGATASTAVGSGVPCSLASECSHGTHVAGIAAGFNAPGGVNGVAPGASLIALQVFTRFEDFTTCGGTPPCVSAYFSDQVLALNRIAALAGPGNATRSPRST
jgi:subtilisin family serine protease